jgi:hypothetical protein
MRRSCPPPRPSWRAARSRCVTCSASPRSSAPAPDLPGRPHRRRLPCLVDGRDVAAADPVRQRHRCRQGRDHQALEGASIKSSIDSSGSITVAEDDYHKARMLLASQNLPKAAPGGYAKSSISCRWAFRAPSKASVCARRARPSSPARSRRSMRSPRRASISPRPRPASSSATSRAFGLGDPQAPARPRAGRVADPRDRQPRRLVGARHGAGERHHRRSDGRPALQEGQ